jgi:hypothetical protein
VKFSIDARDIRPRGQPMAKPVTDQLQAAVNAAVVGVKKGSEIFCLDCRPGEPAKFLVNYALLADGAVCRQCLRTYGDGEWTATRS